MVGPRVSCRSKPDAVDDVEAVVGGGCVSDDEARGEEAAVMMRCVGRREGKRKRKI